VIIAAIARSMADGSAQTMVPRQGLNGRCALSRHRHVAIQNRNVRSLAIIRSRRSVLPEGEAGAEHGKGNSGSEGPG
jgi:hypothetical protein